MREQPEKEFMKIIDNLPYKYVGKGEVVIGGKCPDFVNINGEKIAIEVFDKRHKQNLRNSSWVTERKNIFKKYGWDVLFFDETQINEINIVSKLKGGGNYE